MERTIQAVHIALVHPDPKFGSADPLVVNQNALTSPQMNSGRGNMQQPSSHLCWYQTISSRRSLVTLNRAIRWDLMLLANRLYPLICPFLTRTGGAAFGIQQLGDSMVRVKRRQFTDPLHQLGIRDTVPANGGHCTD